MSGAVTQNSEVLIGLGVVVLAVVALFAGLLGRRLGRQALHQRLSALGTRLGLDAPEEDTSVETALTYLEQVTGAATAAVAETSADAIRLRRSLDALPQGVVICDENGTVVYRNSRANGLMASRHGDALAAQAVTELLEDAWHEGTAERALELYGPPRRTLAVRAQLIDDGRRSLGVIAMIDDVSERRRLEEIRRDFVANVSHELKTPIGALGLLAETLITEPDVAIAQRLASRIHTEAFRVSRIIDDLLDLSRIESEEAPPREPVLVSLVMAEARERVRAAAEQRGISIDMVEPAPPVTVLGERRQLVSAMHALLENAVTYSYDGGAVTISGGRMPHPETVPGNAAVPQGGVAFAAVASATTAPQNAQLSQGDPTTPVRPMAGAGPDPLAPTPSSAPPPPPPSTAGPAHLDIGVDRQPLFLGDGATAPDLREMVRISVTDTGVGIPARDLDRIFERFYRVDHGRSRETGGTGLGLSIARHVANNHQGWVEVESREGEGSTFSLVLPLHDSLRG